MGRALASLVLMRDAAPQSRDANQRLVTLLVRTGLWDDADAATDHYADVVGEDDPDIPFFRGLIARGNGDDEEAVRQFDRFLELAPDDPRAEMIRGLRDDAGAAEPTAARRSPSRAPASAAATRAPHRGCGPGSGRPRRAGGSARPRAAVHSRRW